MNNKLNIARKGVSLLELLAVLVIMGVVMGIAFASFSAITSGAKEDTVEAMALNIVNTFETGCANDTGVVSSCVTTFESSNTEGTDGYTGKLWFVSSDTGLELNIGKYVMSGLTGGTEGISFTLEGEGLTVTVTDGVVGKAA